MPRRTINSASPDPAVIVRREIALHVRMAVEALAHVDVIFALRVERGEDEGNALDQCGIAGRQ